MTRRLYQRAVIALLFAVTHLLPTASAGLAAAPTATALATSQTDWSAWRLPLPAGLWRITRGPCGSSNTFDHECGYYENTCALDYVPVTGSMENVPVLAPADGTVFFVGTRENTGQMVMIRHGDGRASGYMHLARVVVPRDTAVRRGQVIGYAGHTGTAQPHLHFWVQPDVVQRACLDITGLERQDLAQGLATSTNTNWSALALVDPPADLPDWLPIVGAGATETWRLPGQVRVGRGATLMVPVAIQARLTSADSLLAGTQVLVPVRQDGGFASFLVPVRAPTGGSSTIQVALTLQLAGNSRNRPTATLVASVESFVPVRGLTDTIQINPTFVGPSNYAVRTGKAELCWDVARQAGVAPLKYRTLVVRDPAAVAAAGPAATTADSGWIDSTCWTTPALAPGAYLWKVFVSDATGLMNRPNQRPQAVIIR